uniref:Uncharacterized protein n=1 Tax=Rodentolepis nana TaxID=102285 RepID=A0A0R3TZL4_RODNA
LIPGSKGLEDRVSWDDSGGGRRRSTKDCVEVRRKERLR